MSQPDLSKLRIDRSGGTGAAARGGGGLAILAILLLLGYVAWKEWGERSGPDLRRVSVVRVNRLGGGPAKSGVSANGYVVARTRAALSTDIPGRLVDLRVEEGSRVRAGDLIARLDIRELEAERDRGAAELRQAEADERLATLQLERVRPLVERGDSSQAELDEAQAELDRARARVSSARAALAETEVRIDKSSVYAPFDGIVIEKNAEVGEVVSSVSTGTSSRGAVATLVDFSSLEVQVELAQSALGAARPGAPMSIVLDAYPEKSYPGRVRQIWPTADRQKATVELRVEFLERDERILPDLGVRVTFLGEEETAGVAPRVLIPESAVFGAPRTSVFLLEGEVVRLVPVSVAPAAEPGQVEVLSGLRGGELLVDAPAATLADGDRVLRDGGSQ